jgi:hypothetical protein
LIRKAAATNVMQQEENHDEEEDPFRVEFTANGLRKKLGLDCSRGGGTIVDTLFRRNILSCGSVGRLAFKTMQHIDCAAIGRVGVESQWNN